MVPGSVVPGDLPSPTFPKEPSHEQCLPQRRRSAASRPGAEPAERPEARPLRTASGRAPEVVPGAGRRRRRHDQTNPRRDANTRCWHPGDAFVRPRRVRPRGKIVTVRPEVRRAPGTVRRAARRSGRSLPLAMRQIPDGTFALPTRQRLPAWRTSGRSRLIAEACPKQATGTCVSSIGRCLEP